MNKWKLCCLSLALSGTLQAGPLDFVGTMPVDISKANPSSKSAVSQPLVVYVQKINLSPEAKRALSLRVGTVLNDVRYKAVSSLPAKVDLGMSNVPVLDQGQHGSCVTFSVTGAIDAAIKQGDFVSQLCSLELGTYLVSIRKLQYSGWNGSWAELVLNQLRTYGVFPKSYQVKYGCAGVKQYPLNPSSNIGKPMPIAEYTANSKPLSSYVSWQSLASVNEIFSSNFNPATLLTKVKTNLSQGKRVIFGVLLDETQGSAGAVGTKVKRYDTWVLNAVIRKKAQTGSLRAGHEMIIIGYDDNATSRGSDGVVSKGLLKLRNSWGTRAGDGGNYYMSYDYFKILVDDAQAIVKK